MIKNGWEEIYICRFKAITEHYNEHVRALFEQNNFEYLEVRY